MIVYQSACFDRFQCIAGDCPDSCCKEWDVQVDEASAAYYRALPGALGDRLRQVLSDVDGETVMTIEDGRCPMWRRDGLCRIQAELGEQALCRTCREFPRLTHDFGDFAERDLELSCPEAARLLLNARPEEETLLPRSCPGGSRPDYDAQDMALLLRSRQTMLELLSREDVPVPELLAMALLYGCEAQSQLDTGESLPFDPEAALASARELAKPGDPAAVAELFLELEILTDTWRQRLTHPEPGPWDRRTPALARYFVRRYWLRAVSDFDLYSRVKFAVTACLLLRWLGGDFVSTAQLLSKEIENSAENMDTLLDAAYTHSALTDDKLLGMLLENI